MDIKRIVLYALLALLGLSLWEAWDKEHRPAPVPVHAPATQQGQPPIGITPQQAASTTSAADHGLPPQGVNAQSHTNQQSAIPSSRLIHIKTDLVEASIDKLGGYLVMLKLLNYPISLQDKSPMKILNPAPNQWHVFQSGLVAAPGSASVDKHITYQAPKANYVLENNAHVIDVVLTGETSNQLKVTKTYHFTQGRYTVDLNYQVENLGTEPWNGSFYSQLQRRDIKKTHQIANRAFVGASISSPEKPYHKISYNALKKTPISQNIHGGWVALQQRYFLSAMVPEVSETNHYYSQVSEGSNPNGGLFTVGYSAPQMQLAAGASAQGKVTTYIGPELEDHLKQVGEHLALTIDYGWLSFFSELIFKIMSAIHFAVGNWGWSIVLVTLLIKIIFYPLTNKSFVSMAKMKELTPQMKRLKEIHGNDKQALSKATMKLYRDKKVNPLGGCLPMVIQIPVFIALYYVLIESVQLRQAPFMFWIQDLSMKDPFYVLPVLMGISMFLQQKLSPQAPDPQQAKVMMFLPPVFTLLFLNFPSGLVLYWLTNNLLQIAQQWFVNFQYEKAKEKQKLKKMNKR